MKEKRSRLVFVIVWWYNSICCNLLPDSEEENVCLDDLRSTSIYRRLFSLFIADNAKMKGALQTEDGNPFQKKIHIFQVPI